MLPFKPMAQSALSLASGAARLAAIRRLQIAPRWSRSFRSSPFGMSRAFLLDDPGVGLAESDRVSQLATGAWRHTVVRRREEPQQTTSRPKQPDLNYSLAPRRAFYERATPRKLAKRKEWPALPAGQESLMEPFWHAYGNFKALGEVYRSSVFEGELTNLVSSSCWTLGRACSSDPPRGVTSWRAGSL